MEHLRDYVIVEFLETSEVATILKTWLKSESQCLWPKNFNRRLLTMKEQPKSDWDLWKVRILSSCDNLKVAILKERKAQETSDLATESELEEGKGYRRKRKPQRIEDSDSSGNESDLPFPSETGKKFYRREQSSKTTVPPHPVSTTPSCTSPLAKTHSTLLPSQAQALFCASTPKMPSTSSQDSEFSKIRDQIKGLERNLTHIRYQQRDMLEMLTTILETVNRNSGNIIDEDHTLQIDNLKRKFPCKTIEDFIDLEKSLENETQKKITAAFFREVGGVNLDDNIRRILVRMVSDEVAVQFSWEGRRGKRRLIDMALIDLMKCVMRSVH